MPLFGKHYGTGERTRRRSRKIKLSRGGNPTARPIFTRLYGMAAGLVLTLGLMGVVIFLKRTFPKAAVASGYDVPGPVLPRQTLVGNGGLRGTIHADGDLEVRNPATMPLATSFRATIHELPTLGSTVKCSTVDIPAKLLRRQGHLVTSCSTSFYTITPTPSTTRPAILTTLRPPVTFLPLPSMTSEVECSTHTIIEKMAKRSETVDCTTQWVPIRTATPTIADPCLETYHVCPIVKKDLDERGEMLRGRDQWDDCTTLTRTATSCLLDTTTSSPCVHTSYRCPITKPRKRYMNKRDQWDYCETILSTASSCMYTSTSDPPDTTTSDACVQTSYRCPITRPKERGIGKRGQWDGCETILSTAASCLPTSTSDPDPSTITPPPSTSQTDTACYMTSTDCNIIWRKDLGRRQTDCRTLVLETACQEPTTSSTSSTSSEVSSTPNTSEVNSSTESPTSPTITDSTDSTTAPTSTDSCLASRVSCTTIPIIGRLGKRYETVDCSTAYSTLPDCISTSSSTSSTSSSLPTTSLPSTSISSSSITPSSTSSPPSTTGPSFSSSSSSTGSSSTNPLSSSSSLPTTSTAPTSTSPSSSSPLSSIPPPSSSISSSTNAQSTIDFSSTSASSLTSGSSTSGSSTSGSSTSGSSLASGFPPNTGSISTIPLLPSSTPSSSPTIPSSSIAQSSSSSPHSVWKPTPSGSLGYISPYSQSTSTPSLPALVPSGTLSTAHPSTPATTFFSSAASPASGPQPGQTIQPTGSVVTAGQGTSSSTASSATISPLPTTTSPPSLSQASAPSQSTASTISRGSSNALVQKLPSSSLSLGVASDTTSSASSMGNVTPTSKGLTIPPQSASATDSAAISSSTADIGNAAFNTRVVWPTWKVPESLPNHVPVLLGRAFMLVATPLYHQLMTHDPVRQLTSPGGATGAVLAGSPFGALDIGLLSAQIGSAFAAGSLVVDTNYCNTRAVPGNLNPCPPRMSVTPWAIDVVLACLVAQVIVIIYAMSKWFQKPSGLSADPTTIAGVAAVMGHPDIERQFSGFPGEITQKELKSSIKDQRYKLGTFMTETGLMKYGIMPAGQKEKRTQTIFNRSKKSSSPGTSERATFLRDWKQNRLYSDLIFATFLLALLGLTAAALARVDSPQTVFLATAAASGTGMKIFFAAMGIIVSFYWGRLFQDAQTFTAYLPLRAGDAQPNPTILLNRHSNPITAFMPLLKHRHFAAASIAATGICAELLIVALAGLPYRPGQLRGEFVFCAIMALAIVSLMIAQLVLVNMWRRALPHLPRRPDNIAAVMTYVAGTTMVRDFYGLEELSVRDRNKAVMKMGKTYEYGWRKEDETGRTRWIVDEVPDQEKKSFLS